MKKILILLLMLTMVFSLVACDGLETTDALTTIETTTEAPTTIEPTTDVPSSETPTTIEATTEEPTTEEPTTEDPTTEVPTTEDPTTEVPTTEVPTTEEPTTEEPTTEEHTTEEPTTEVPTTEEPTTSNPIVEINLFSVNDFHGGAYRGMEMISRIGYYLKNQDDSSIILTNGDMLQGSALSNYYHGRVLVDVLNDIGFNGFVIGNHEFDWGIDVVLNYRDGDLENGELNHPILAANIVYKDTQEPLENTVPYIIEEVEGVSVGVIGLIGLVMNSIAVSRTENIEFLDPVEVAAQYARDLRVNHDVDVVVVYVHEGSYFNYRYANLSGLERIDAVFNGHTHQNEASYVSRDGLDMPYAQMNNYNTSLVHIQLIYDKSFGGLVSFNVYGINNSVLSTNDSDIDLILSNYQTDEVYQSYISEVLTVAQGNFGRYDLVQWGSSVIRDYVGADIGATNAGGFRVSMYMGNVTMGDMITIYPFDNVIKTSEMTGQQIQDFYLEILNGSDDVVFDDGLYYNYSTQRLEINGEPIILDQYYTIAAVDYIFDQTKYDFIEGINIQQTIHFMRDLLVEDLRNTGGSFNPSNGSNYID